MAAELREIPPAPRDVRWSAVIWQRWVLLLLGGPLTVYGGLLTLLAWLGGNSSYYATAERRLDADATQTIGMVTDVRPGESWRGERTDRVAFRFVAADGSDQDGQCWCSRGSTATAEPATIEYLVTEPSLCRVAGGHLAFPTSLHLGTIGLLVIPGLGLLGLWLAGVPRSRRLLRDGDAAIAVPFAVRRVAFVLPTMLEIRFRFRDRHAEIREGRHWVRARSLLGARLPVPVERLASRISWLPGRMRRDGDVADRPEVPVERLPKLIVVHDREHPEHQRLVVPSDFATVASPSRDAPPDSWLG